MKRDFRKDVKRNLEIIYL